MVHLASGAPPESRRPSTRQPTEVYLDSIRRAIERAVVAGVPWIEIERTTAQCRHSLERRMSMIAARSP